MGSAWSRSATSAPSDEDLEEYEKRCAQFGVTTGRFSKGENLTVGEGVSITLPSEQKVELYTEIEFTGTETGATQPRGVAEARAGRRHPLDRSLPDRRG